MTQIRQFIGSSSKVDLLVIVYFVIVTLGILKYIKNKKVNSEEPETSDRLYTYSKSSKMAAWKAKMIGNWAKIERKNFFEFCIFNGVPKLVAYAIRDSDFGNVIAIKNIPGEDEESDKISIKIDAYGKPEAEGVFHSVQTAFDPSCSFDSKDPQGRSLKGYAYWKYLDEDNDNDEAEGLNIEELKANGKKFRRVLCHKFENLVNKDNISQFRSFVFDKNLGHEVLRLKTINTRPSGESCYFTAIFKKKD